MWYSYSESICFLFSASLLTVVLETSQGGLAAARSLVLVLDRISFFSTFSWVGPIWAVEAGLASTIVLASEAASTSVEASSTSSGSNSSSRSDFSGSGGGGSNSSSENK